MYVPAGPAPPPVPSAHATQCTGIAPQPAIVKRMLHPPCPDGVPKHVIELVTDVLLATQSAVERLFFPNLPFAAQRTVDSMCRCALDRLHNLGNAERPIWIGERR